eukprot:Tbor_TRINITY_DN5336_c6_g3::TRINITY_DN5336_c6_g3_i2::g.5197::m.5197/K14769/UTP11; U3 small nucleolar RNA-associated protein 11
MTKGKGKNPGAGNLDKHIKREAHKERPQLNKRKHLGSLEKHKDYKLRSQRRHKKENKLFQIKRAIAQKNPDEFNCKMTKLYIDNDSGYIKKRYDKNNKKKEILAEIEENNNNNIYLKHKARMDSNRAKELLNEVTGIQTSTILINNNINNINNNNKSKHTIFVDDEEKFKSFDAVNYFNTSKELLPYPSLRGNINILGNIIIDNNNINNIDNNEHVVLTAAQKRRAKRRNNNIINNNYNYNNNNNNNSDNEDDENNNNNNNNNDYIS